MSEEIIEMSEEIINQIIIYTINGEQHLGDNLKKECINYITNLQKENQQLKEELKKYINSSDFVYDELYKKRETIEKILGDKENE